MITVDNFSSLQQEKSSEYFVSTDGNHTGITEKGLAELCGITEAELIAILEALEAKAPSLPSSIKHLSGKSLSTCPNTGYIAKSRHRIILSTYCWDLIVYFAVHSPLDNRIALGSMVMFGSQGIHQYILNQTRYTKVSCPSDSTYSEDLREISKKHINLNLHEIGKPGLAFINEEYEKAPKRYTGDYFSLNQWLEDKGIVLDRSRMVVFVRRVASNYRTLMHREPEKRRAFQYGRPNDMNRINVYTEEDEPIIEAAIKYVLTHC